jgi:signal transduction histidine kinase
MYLVFKGVAIACSSMFVYRSGVGIDYMLILVLAFSCVIMASFLFDRIGIMHNDIIQIIINTTLLLTSFLLDMKSLFPFIIILIFQMVESFAKGINFYYMLMGSTALAMVIINTKADVLMYTGLLVIIMIYTKIIRDKAEINKIIILEQKDELARLNQKLLDNNRLVKTLQYTAALEERNRLAIRLHDKVGHGISGSIILLEASRLMFDTNMEKAKDGIDKAILNLRDGVDDIRLALREERPIRSELGLSELHTILEKFRVTHNIVTSMHHSGNLSLIGMDIWQCIYENLEETLTNLLKHSNATKFKLSIHVFNKVIKVEYQDNGKSETKFVKGLGLEAIEERAIKCGGRCFIEKMENEFRITNIFTY